MASRLYGQNISEIRDLKESKDGLAMTPVLGSFFLEKNVFNLYVANIIVF